jgi:putative ABC transport system ATP-binding protein
MGLLDPGFEGEYWLDGNAVHGCSARTRQELQRRHIGFVFQHYHLLDDLSVEENLDVPLSYRNVPTAERRRRIAGMLERFGLGAHRGMFPRQLSGGQQQMVAVARAVIAAPSLLLADEPTGALHSDQGREIMRLFGELNREGMTIVQVTHNPEYAASAGRSLELRDGWMKELSA